MILEGLISEFGGLRPLAPPCTRHWYDPIWHVISRSDVVISRTARPYIRFTLLYFFTYINFFQFISSFLFNVYLYLSIENSFKCFFSVRPVCPVACFCFLEMKVYDYIDLDYYHTLSLIVMMTNSRFSLLNVCIFVILLAVGLLPQ